MAGMQSIDPDLRAEIDAALPHLTPDELADLTRMLRVGLPVWMPQAGPQTMAAESQADILLYGGSAGSGKTDLLIGLAITQHHRSIIFRREAVQLVGIEERTAAIMGSRKGYNSQDSLWRLPDVPGLPKGRTLEFGSVKEPGDWIKYQGRPHDFIGFDEGVHFLEQQVRTLMGWLRSEHPSVRRRVVIATNPPTDADGEWVIRFFAPWLDPEHPNKAKPGELRWFITDEEGHDIEVGSPRAVQLRSGRWVTPLSRTFVPGRVKDNLFLTATGYESMLDALPEPLRSQMRDGNFLAGRSDDVWQAIPSAWIKAAQARWQPRHDKGTMTALGFDVARGGIDNSCLARRHGAWFDEPLTVPGVVTHDGPSAAGWAVQHARDGCPVVIDSIGIGSSALDFCRGLNLNAVPFVGSEGTQARDKTGRLRFRNVRALAYWRLREALDPTATTPIALPPDPELFADLAAVRYKVVTAGQEVAILMRDKDEIREMLGRSPDKGDAVAMTFLDGLETAMPTNNAEQWRSRKRMY